MNIFRMRRKKKRTKQQLTDEQKFRKSDLKIKRYAEKALVEMADIRDDPYLQVLARKVVNVKDALSANWMILDFAAIICQKRRPRCPDCPLLQRCQYARKSIISTY